MNRLIYFIFCIVLISCSKEYEDHISNFEFECEDASNAILSASFDGQDFCYQMNSGYTSNFQHISFVTTTSNELTISGDSIIGADPSFARVWTIDEDTYSREPYDHFIRIISNSHNSPEPMRDDMIEKLNSTDDLLKEGFSINFNYVSPENWDPDKGGFSLGEFISEPTSSSFLFVDRIDTLWEHDQTLMLDVTFKFSCELFLRNGDYVADLTNGVYRTTFEL